MVPIIKRSIRTGSYGIEGGQWNWQHKTQDDKQSHFGTYEKYVMFIAIPLVALTFVSLFSSGESYEMPMEDGLM